MTLGYIVAATLLLLPYVVAGALLIGLVMLAKHYTRLRRLKRRGIRRPDFYDDYDTGKREEWDD